MTNAQRIIEEISAVLKEASPEATRLSRLATDYAAACRDVNARLTQIQEVLDAGDDRQALWIAESPPPVMDDADALSFAQIDRWKALCAAEGLQPAPVLKATVVHRLNALYAKGISGDHRIYKDFRSAILSRDDEKALTLARAIEKLCPNDSNAGKERVRLEEKVFRQRVSALEQAIASGDGTSVEQALQSVREFGARGDEAEPPAVAKANELLRDQRARAAMIRCKDWAGQLGKLVTAGEWQAVGDILARVDEASREHGFVFPGEIQTELKSGRDFFSAKRAEFLENAAFQTSLKDLQSEAETVESHIQMPGVKPVAQLSEFLTTLNRCWQKVNSYGREVDDDIIQRVSKQVDALRTEIARRQKNRLITTLAGVAASIVVVAVLGWYLLGMYRANEMASEIASAIAANQVSVVEQLIATANDGALTRFSATLHGRMEEGQTWLDGRSSEAGAAIEQLSSFESAALDGFKSWDVVTSHRQFGELMTSIEAMPDEKKVDLVPRAVKVREALTTWAQGRGQEMTDATRQSVEVFEADLVPALAQKQSMQSFDETLGRAEKALAGWDETIGAGVPGFSLPPALQASIDGHRDTLTGMRTQLDELKTDLAAIEAAGSLTDYTAAVSQASDSRLVQLEEVQALGPVARQKFDQESLTAELMFPWNPAAWSAFLKGDEASRLHPEETLQVEDTIFGRIYNDQFTQSIYQADVSGRPNRRIYTKGTGLLVDERDEFSTSNYETRRIKTFTGSMYDPAVDGSVIRFQMRTLTASSKNDEERVTDAKNIGPSAPSTIFSRMQLDGFYKDGKPILSFWEVLDRATAAGAESPLYLGFVAQQFSLINDTRPYAWGAHFTPSGAEFLRQVRTATGGASIRSGSWLSPGDDEEIAAQLTPIFSEPSVFLKEAMLNRSLARSAKAAGTVVYAGYVGMDGKPVITRSTPLADALWGLSGNPPEQTASLLFKLAPKDETGAQYEAVGSAQPFSPLFYFPGDRKKMFEAAEREVAPSPDVLKRLQLPPLFHDIASQQEVNP